MFVYNEIGNILKFSIFGGSHQIFIGGVLKNFPEDVTFDANILNHNIDRRRPRLFGTPRKEEDKVVFSCNMQDGDTIPQNISFHTENKSIDTSSYDNAKQWFRPSHADYVYYKKYGENSLLYKDEASGRVTLPMVVAGSLCRMFLQKRQINILAEVEKTIDNKVLDNGDSIGGKILCTISNVPAGIGEPIFYKIQSMLAQAMMSIPSAVSFELGEGEKRTMFSGSEDLDEWEDDNSEDSPYFKTRTNNSGGINAGISNGNNIVFHVGFHAVHTLGQPTKMINDSGMTEEKVFGGRHDKAHIFRLPVVVESLSAIVLTDLILMNQKK